MWLFRYVHQICLETRPAVAGVLGSELEALTAGRLGGGRERLRGGRGRERENERTDEEREGGWGGGGERERTN